MSRYHAIDFSGALVTGNLQRTLVLRDQPPPSPNVSNTEDYFILIAEWLEEVAERLGARNRYETAKLYRIIDDLLYLHAYYQIRKKPR